MYISYDVEKINKTLKDFNSVTGINIRLLKDDFSTLGCVFEDNKYCLAIQNTEEGKEACYNSDIDLLQKCKKSRKIQMHVCHAGLIDIVVPIIYKEEIIGYILLGQLKRDNDFSSVEKYISKFSLNPEEIKEYYTTLSLFEYDKIQSVAALVSMLVKYIIIEKMLKLDFNKVVESAEAFIEENLSKSLSIELISKSTHISKSVLYKNFRTVFNCTVSQYVNRKRVEKSVDLLLNSDLSIEEISQKVGFSSASYYTINFKKEKGVSPIKFRKNASA